MRILFFCFFLVLALQPGHPVFGQERSSAKVLAIKVDSSQISLRKFDAQQIEDYRKQKEFQYRESVPTESLWDRFKRWLNSLFMRLIEDEGSRNTLGYFAIAALAALIAFIISKLIGADLSIFSRKTESIELNYELIEENIHEINFSEQIDQAVERGDFRLALRLCYLRSLKMMSDRQLIHWLPGKTNRTYLEELEEPDKKEAFSRLTKQFEYIWYGEFPIGNTHFSELRGDFDDFNTKLS